MVFFKIYLFIFSDKTEKHTRIKLWTISDQLNRNNWTWNGKRWKWEKSSHGNFSSRRWKFVSLTASTFFMCASRHDEHTMIFRCWKALSNILALTHKPMMFSTFFFFSFLSFLFCKYFPYSTLTLNVINLLLPSIFVSFNSSHIVVGVSSASNSSIYDFKVWLFFDFLLYCLQKSMT